MTAFVLGVSTAFTVSAVTHIVSGSTSQKTGHRAGRRDRLGRGPERERRDDDLVARPDAQRAQRDRERLGAVGDADRVPRADVGGELGLERLDLGPEDEVPAVEHAMDRGADVGAQRRLRGGRVEERDRHRHEA